MVRPETFVSELAAKNQATIDRVIGELLTAIAKESFDVSDVLRLMLKTTIEGTEVAALWLADCDDLEMKLALAEQCGDGARHYRLLADRLATLAPAPIAYDPRAGGYSKVFAFLRSLQTAEERTSAGNVTGKTLSLARLAALGAWCEEHGDADTARLLRDELSVDESRHLEQGRRALVTAAPAEESQARARRAAYRALELVSEMYEPLQLRKTVQKKR